jgi:hypothetical protein
VPPDLAVVTTCILSFNTEVWGWVFVSFCFVFVALGIKPGALCMLGKHLASELYPRQLTPFVERLLCARERTSSVPHSFQ